MTPATLTLLAGMEEALLRGRQAGRRSRSEEVELCYANRYIWVFTLRGREVVHWRDCLDPIAVFDALG